MKGTPNIYNGLETLAGADGGLPPNVARRVSLTRAIKQLRDREVSILACRPITWSSPFAPVGRD
jgi:hypothetical protein